MDYILLGILTVSSNVKKKIMKKVIVTGGLGFIGSNLIKLLIKNDYNLIASQQIDGIRNLAIWDDKIIVSRGDYDNTTFLPISFSELGIIFSRFLDCF